MKRGLTTDAPKPMRVIAKLTRRELTMLKLKAAVAHGGNVSACLKAAIAEYKPSLPTLGKCCNTELRTEFRDEMAFEGATVRNVPVRVCPTCGEVYYNLYLMAALDEEPIADAAQVLGLEA